MYQDIFHTPLGEHSIARWARSREGIHLTLYYANFTKIAKVCLNIMNALPILIKHTFEVICERVILLYMLMTGMDINVGAISRII